MDYFVFPAGVKKSLGKRINQVISENGKWPRTDLRVISEKSYGSALQYFTGSKEHNIAVRKIAMEKGLKLNEYGVF